MSQEQPAASTSSAGSQPPKAMKLMRFWLIGTFVIVFAAITAYIMIFNGGNVLAAIMSGLPIWGITLIACVVIFVGYYFYMKRKA